MAHSGSDARFSELYEPQQLWASSSRFSRACLLSMFALGVFWCVARFWSLETAPYGIWMDESRVALHTTCLGETGQPAGSEYWPWFAPAFGGGHHPSLLIYFELAWTKLFGNAIASFRAAIALVNIVTILALTLLARRMGGSLLALMVFVSAAISPWSFQFSRILWEGPLAAASLVLAVYCMWHPPRWYWAVATGVFGALAMYCYPPLRLTTPLVLSLVGLCLLRSRTRRWRVRDLALAVGALLLTFAPILLMTLQGRLSARALSVVIFSPEYADAHRGAMSRMAFVCSSFLDNLLSHFRASFLFFSGDQNVRHSPQIVGQLSPVDAVALLGVLGWLGWSVFRALRSAAALQLEASGYRRKLLLIAGAGVIGFVCGSVPAALTWDGEPHSLRSIAAWPWACLAGGAALAFWVTKRPQLVLPVLCAGTLLYSFAYLPSYFRVGKTLPKDAFRSDLREAVDTRGSRPILDVVRPWLDAYGGEEELRYYLIRWGGYSCEGSDQALRELHDKLRSERKHKRGK